MAANYLWSFVWESPLKKEMSAIEMKDLKIENTKSDRFGDVLLLVDKKKSTGYAGRKFKEDAFSNAETKKSVLKEFPKIASQLCSISHDNIERMHGVFFADSVTFLPVLVYEQHLQYRLQDYLSVREGDGKAVSVMKRRESEKVRILQDVACGLEYLHSRRPPIHHHNLTVANVFVSQNDPVWLPTAKIADAGVNKLGNLGSKTRINPPIIDYLPEGERDSTWGAEVDVLCYGVLAGHVVLQESIVSTLPIFFRQDISDTTARHLHMCLKLHPLYQLIQQCLRESAHARLTALDVKRKALSDGAKTIEWDKKIQEEAREWMKKSVTLDIMITGKTGSGKTALINGLIGKKVGEEGEELSRGTTIVEKKVMQVENTTTHIWDTPGLQDDTNEEDRYLYEMKKYCSDCNLYIYCISMSQRRLDAAENRAIKALTETFGKDFWAKVLFVLTFANNEMAHCPVGHNEEAWFENRMELWHDQIAKKLVDVSVDEGVANNIKIVPAGYSKPLKKHPNPWPLPGIEHWFHNFWYRCAEVMDQRGLPALVAANVRRLKTPEEIAEIDMNNCPIEEQPIPVGEGSLAGAAGMAVAGTAVSAGLGAGIGATVGSVVGILAGPVGVAGGAAVGGVLGTVVIDPILVSLYWNYSKKDKKSD